MAMQMTANSPPQASTIARCGVRCVSCTMTHRAMQELVLPHRIQQPRGGIDAGQCTREHADHGSEIHDHRHPAETRFRRHVGERRRARKPSVLPYRCPSPRPCSTPSRVKNSPANAPQPMTASGMFLRGFADSFAKRRRTFEAHEAEYHERQRREHGPILEGCAIFELRLIDHASPGTRQEQAP